MQPEWIPLFVFVVCYALFVALPRWRSLVACAGAVALVLSGALSWQEALAEKIHWNVIALFFGTLVLAELFMQSRMPAVMAEWLVDHTRTMRQALLAVCALAGGLSMFIENVAVVLLVAPVALSLAEKLQIRPVPLLICIAISTNLQGTATLIGDPPSMILAGYMKMTFNDFFIYHGKPGIFFAVQIGAIASLMVVAWLMRHHRESVALVPVEEVRAWVPTWLLSALVVGLAFTSHFDPEFKWLAGSFTMILAVVGLLWHHLGPRWMRTVDLIRTLDWDTTFFLCGIFVIVGGLADSGWLDTLASTMTDWVGGSPLVAYVSIIGLSVAVSAFVDNVPFLLTMIPVTQTVADNLGVPVPFLMFGLLIGSCLGGNITPIGASANIVSVGLLKKQGHLVSFREFMSIGIPFTLAAVVAASV
ncbi:MAG: SLC13 family permease, partial [Verrucomicrobiae bacterium]|nr:SLC13 family permease [Verrucomicrobiae bacterium]